MSKVKVIDMDVLEGKTVIELRELCKKYGIAGVSRLRKDEICWHVILLCQSQPSTR